MTYTAHITVMPLKELLDPQGKAVMGGLANLGLNAIKDVRIGKHITLTLEAETEEEASETVDNACRKLLANLIMENFVFELTAIE